MNIRKESKTKNFSDSLLPMTISSWLIGCGGVIEYPLGNSQVVFSFIYSTVCALNYCFILYLSTYYDQNTFFEDSFFINGFIVLSTIILGWTRRQGLKLFIEKIKRADKLLQKLGISENYDKIYRRQLCLVASACIVNIAIMIINLARVPLLMCSKCELSLKILYLMKNHYPTMLLYFNDLNFVGIMWCLRRKFAHLNDLLEKLSETSPIFPQYLKLIYFKTGINKASSVKLGQKTNDDTNIMRISKQVHLDLVKICRLSNQIFGFHLLISLTLASASIIIICYNNYIEYMYLTEGPKYDKIIASFAYLFFYIMKILTVNYICDKTSNEALRTGSIINELHEPTTNKEFRMEIREFTLQLIQHPLTFTACGFFNLNNTFIQKVSGSVTTYLIILIQLRDLN